MNNKNRKAMTTEEKIKVLKEVKKHYKDLINYTHPYVKVWWFDKGIYEALRFYLKRKDISNLMIRNIFGMQKSEADFFLELGEFDDKSYVFSGKLSGVIGRYKYIQFLIDKLKKEDISTKCCLSNKGKVEFRKKGEFHIFKDRTEVNNGCYITIDQAVRLKDLGFNPETNRYYNVNQRFVDRYFVSNFQKYHNKRFNKIAVVTKNEAIEWLFDHLAGFRNKIIENLKTK